MESTVKAIRIIQIAMLVSIALYVFIGQSLASAARASNPVIFYVLSLAAITIVGVILVVRRTLVLQSEATLKTRPTDVATLNRWKSGYIVTDVLSESLAVFGLVLCFVGFTLSQVAPFYLAGFILMLFFRPRQPSAELT